MSELRFDEQVVVITGAGRGLGAAYAKFFASRGAKVVVNDLGVSLNGTGSDSSVARDIVQQIRDAGGIAVPDYNSVENGDRIIETAINTFGEVHVLINNAGIAIKDAGIADIDDEDWYLATTTYITGSYRTSFAAWPHFVSQKFGRIINTGALVGFSGEAGKATQAGE
jgi:NAD(P)-dependent dehydrogenase (short-subunit alcohol dehydrogenase family)